MVTDYEKLVIGEYHEQKGFKEGLEQGRAEGREQGRAEGREQGRAEGGKERALNSARNMLARGYEVSEIAEVTELTPEEINALQQ